MKKKYRVTLVKEGEVCRGDVELNDVSAFVKTCASYGWVLTEHFELGKGLEHVECTR